MSKFTEFTFPSSNGKTAIRVRKFEPETAPRGIVQIAHGVAEHCERYDAFMEFLAANGFVAAANDHLGHGKSISGESDLGFFTEKDGWDHVVRDMHKLHELLTEEYPELPCFLFGHSMGSFLARTYIIRYPDELTGAIICGTGQQSPALVGAGKAMAGMICGLRGVKHKSDMLNKTAFGKYNEGFETVRTPCDWLSRDKANVDKYIADPLCGFVPTAGLFRDMMGGISFIGKPENIEKMRKDLPVFFIAGDKDPVGENGKGVQKAYDLFKEAGMKDVTLKLYPDCRHELLNELNKDEVMADILGWLNEKMPE
ncbi:MAG: lysophospholipase [Clostridia bacterium]|nr:lysophospholipase [Clostridia bacterium]